MHKLSSWLILSSLAAGCVVMPGDDTSTTPDDPQDVVTLRGDIGCEGCDGAVVVEMYATEYQDGEALFSASVAGVGAFELDVPEGLGDGYLFAFGDNDGDGHYSAGEPFGVDIAGAVHVGDADVEGLAIELTSMEAEPAEAGIVDEFGAAIAPDRLFVWLDEGIDGIAVAEELAAMVGGVAIEYLDELHALELELPSDATDPLAALQEAELVLRERADVTEVARDYYAGRVEARPEHDDNITTGMSGKDRWAYEQIRLDDGKELYDRCSYHFDASERARDVTVAVIDNDLEGAKNHPELASKVRSFEDFHVHAGAKYCGLDDVSAPIRLCEKSTESWHGGGVASVIGALNDGTGMNGVLAGYAGTTPKGSAYAVDYGFRFYNLNHGRSFSVSEAIRAMRAAARSDARVINMSWGIKRSHFGRNKPFGVWAKAFAKIVKAYPTKTWVMSAGNGNYPLYLRNNWSSLLADNLIVAGATDQKDERSSFSNHGMRHVSMSAPGTDIYLLQANWTHSGTSLHPELTHTAGASTYARSNGTSFSAPMLTGGAAFAIAMDSTTTPTLALNQMRWSGDDIAATSGGKRLQMLRLTTRMVAREININTNYLMDFNGKIGRASGNDASCYALQGDAVGHSCVPVVGESSLKNPQDGIADVNGNAYTLAGSLAGTDVGDALQFTIDGFGITAGIGPANTIYTATVKADPDPNAPKGNLYVEGTFQATTHGHPQVHCDYDGTFTARLYRGEVD